MHDEEDQTTPRATPRSRRVFSGCFQAASIDSEMTDSNNNLQDQLQLDPSDGVPYVEELRERLQEVLANIRTIEDAKERLIKKYPESKVVDMAIFDATEKLNKSQSSTASITVTLNHLKARMAHLVFDGVAGKSESDELTGFKTAVIDFIINDVTNLARDFVNRSNGNYLITRSDIRTAMHADGDLVNMFLSDDETIAHIHPSLASIHDKRLRKPQTCVNYKQAVRRMVDSENSFIRGLKLIIEVFKVELFQKFIPTRRQIPTIFCNIEELLELSILFVDTLEESLETVGQTDEVPFVGAELLDIAMAEEFNSYFTFARKRLSNEWRDAYQNVINDDSIGSGASKPLDDSIQTFNLAVKHLLPNYLINTATRFFSYYDDIEHLYDLSKNQSTPDDEFALKETLSIMTKTKKAIENLLITELRFEQIEPLDEKLAESIKSNLERRLDAILQEEKNKPLPYMPPPTMYKFSEPDTPDNIKFDDLRGHKTDMEEIDKADGMRVIRCATLEKLVERLTYHKHQPSILEAFLITYRFFSSPRELLKLLIERFNIPDPPIHLMYPGFNGSPRCERMVKQNIRRFRQEYSKPVKMRVINVLKSWVKNHFYDFEKEPELLADLVRFLDEVHKNEVVLRGLIEPIQKSIEKQIKAMEIKKSLEPEIMLSRKPPEILWFTAKANEPESFNILTLHPVELARQLTLLQFDLFRAIKPSELINAANETSPSLKSLSRQHTLFSYWIQRCILKEDSLDKRAAIYNRTVEIMGALRNLNNYNGLLSVGSAVQATPIDRLAHTKKTLTNANSKYLVEYLELTEDHQKKLEMALKRCNPPCIPYMGSYQTKLLQAREGNRTFIEETISPTLSNDESRSFSNSPGTPISPNTPRMPCSPFPPSSAASTSTQQNQFFGKRLINFRKQLIRAGLVTDVLNYQNEPYCFEVQPQIRNFIKSINDEMLDYAINLEKDTEKKNQLKRTGNVTAMTKLFEDDLYELSLKVEPRDCPKPPRLKSKLPKYYNSPGIEESKLH